MQQEMINEKRVNCWGEAKRFCRRPNFFIRPRAGKTARPCRSSVWRSDWKQYPALGRAGRPYGLRYQDQPPIG